MIDITVNHNDDRVEISVEGTNEHKTFKMRGGYDQVSMAQVEEMLKYLVNRINDAHETPDINLTRVMDDEIRTVESW